MMVVFGNRWAPMGSTFSVRLPRTLLANTACRAHGTPLRCSTTPEAMMSQGSWYDPVTRPSHSHVSLLVLSSALGSSFAPRELVLNSLTVSALSDGLSVLVAENDVDNSQPLDMFLSKATSMP